MNINNNDDYDDVLLTNKKSRGIFLFITTPRSWAFETVKQAQLERICVVTTATILHHSHIW